MSFLRFRAGVDLTKLGVQGSHRLLAAFPVLHPRAGAERKSKCPRGWSCRDPLLDQGVRVFSVQDGRDVFHRHERPAAGMLERDEQGM
jgi:hypothetical protein